MSRDQADATVVTAWWVVAAAANGVVAVAYLAISFLVYRGLRTSPGSRRNWLGWATAAIFFTCAVHHGSHTAHMLLPYAGMDVHAGEAMRTALGHSYHTALWDVLTAAVGIWYWTLRGRFPALVRGAAVFDDLRLRDDAERNLRDSEERYRRIIETTSEGILVTDAAGTVQFSNPRLGVMIGIRTEQLLGRHYSDLLQGTGRSELDQLFTVPDTGAACTGQPGPIDVALRHRDGHQIDVQLSGTPLRDRAGGFDGALAMITDVTAQKELEAQFRQAQKLEAVGQLAGGIAHDFNNLLTVIDGYAAVLLATLDPAGAERTHAEQIRAAAGRATALTRQLLQFSSRQPTQPRKLDLNEVVGALGEMLRRLIQADIELTFELAGTALPVVIDRGQFEQVLVNLVVNARDAMPDGGQLTIATRQVGVPGPALERVTGLVPGDYARVTVSDTGHGMTPEVASRVFEPFFTTKEPGKGTGLGLATAYGIVRQAAGHIDISSAPGAGAAFSVLFPLDQTQDTDSDTALDTAATAPAGPGTGGARPAGDATVLLVEDDKEVRALARQILSDAGYTVVAADGAARALDLHAGRAGGPNDIDVLLTDVMMPGMNGRQLADQLLAQIPDLPVVFMSAYPHSALADSGEPGQERIFLNKPFTPAQLVGSVREALNRRSGFRSVSRETSGTQ